MNGPKKPGQVTTSCEITEQIASIFRNLCFGGTDVVAAPEETTTHDYDAFSSQANCAYA
jgi:hypothetical protein